MEQSGSGRCVGIGTFKKLMSSLVESSMLYGDEIWGCSRNLEALEQMKPLCMFLGVGTLHLSVIIIRNGDLPVVWLARLHCTAFWLFSVVKQGV